MVLQENSIGIYIEDLEVLGHRTAYLVLSTIILLSRMATVRKDHLKESVDQKSKSRLAGLF